jgi:hypothetical protein
MTQWPPSAGAAASHCQPAVVSASRWGREFKVLGANHKISMQDLMCINLKPITTKLELQAKHDQNFNVAMQALFLLKEQTARCQSSLAKLSCLETDDCNCTTMCNLSCSGLSCSW